MTRVMKYKRRIIGFSCTLVVVWLTHGSIRGVEWSPDLLTHRSYRYHAVFSGVLGHGIPVTSREIHEWESDLDRWLKEQGYAEQRAANPRWYVQQQILSSLLDFDVVNGEANDLCGDMRCSGGESKQWIEWSKLHPEIAADLWPRYVKMVRSDQSGRVAASSLLHLIQYAGDDITFKEYCDLCQFIEGEVAKKHERGREPEPR